MATGRKYLVATWLSINKILTYADWQCQSDGKLCLLNNLWQYIVFQIRVVWQTFRWWLSKANHRRAELSRTCADSALSPQGALSDALQATSMVAKDCSVCCMPGYTAYQRTYKLCPNLCYSDVYFGQLLHRSLFRPAVSNWN